MNTTANSSVPNGMDNNSYLTAFLKDTTNYQKYCDAFRAVRDNFNARLAAHKDIFTNNNSGGLSDDDIKQLIHQYHRNRKVSLSSDNGNGVDWGGAMNGAAGIAGAITNPLGQMGQNLGDTVGSSIRALAQPSAAPPKPRVTDDAEREHKHHHKIHHKVHRVKDDDDGVDVVTPKQQRVSTPVKLPPQQPGVVVTDPAQPQVTTPPAVTSKPVAPYKPPADHVHEIPVSIERHSQGVQDPDVVITPPVKGNQTGVGGQLSASTTLDATRDDELVNDAHSDAYAGDTVGRIPRIPTVPYSPSSSSSGGGSTVGSSFISPTQFTDQAASSVAPITSSVAKEPHNNNTNGFINNISSQGGSGFTDTGVPSEIAIMLDVLHAFDPYSHHAICYVRIEDDMFDDEDINLTTDTLVMLFASSVGVSFTSCPPLDTVKTIPEVITVSDEYMRTWWNHPSAAKKLIAVLDENPLLYPGGVKPIVYSSDPLDEELNNITGGTIVIFHEPREFLIPDTFFTFTALDTLSYPMLAACGDAYDVEETYHVNRAMILLSLGYDKKVEETFTSARALMSYP